jgi:glycosyltransferase involved in cell wall biosynthesis
MAGSIAFILKGYPRLSETFIAQEILGLEHAGLDLVIVSLRRPTDPARHPIHNEIRAPVLYLPEYLHEEPIRVWRGFWSALRSGFLARVLGVFWHDLRRDPTRNRLRRLGQACVLARELPTAVDRLYVHYLHTPASVARYTARMRNLPFAISAHAKDIWTIPDWEIREKLADAAWLTTCTSLGFRHLRNLAPNARLICLPHGIDLARLPASSACAAAGTETPSPPIELVTVARAVEKKGLDILLEALSMLPPDIDWRWRHIGGGPLLPKLRAQRNGWASPGGSAGWGLSPSMTCWRRCAAPISSALRRAWRPTAIATAFRTWWPRQCRSACRWSLPAPAPSTSSSRTAGPAFSCRRTIPAPSPPR